MNENLRKLINTFITQTNEWFDFTSQVVGDGFWVIDADTKEEWISPHVISFLGAGDDEIELTLDLWHSNIDSRDLFAFYQNVNINSINPLAGITQVLRVNRFDGSTSYVKVRGKLLDIRNHRILFCGIYDLTLQFEHISKLNAQTVHAEQQSSLLERKIDNANEIEEENRVLKRTNFHLSKSLETSTLRNINVTSYLSNQLQLAKRLRCNISVFIVASEYIKSEDSFVDKHTVFSEFLFHLDNLLFCFLDDQLVMVQLSLDEIAEEQMYELVLEKISSSKLLSTVQLTCKRVRLSYEEYSNYSKFESIVEKFNN